ncbi:RNA polymerase sigma factor [Alkalihalobacterium elongatum]|uniref:RNA polymerase sigma factor n=1 Tax=Alkalihalobacterium elongatum TaxID=2675466 RepID=UPI001C1FDE40|nr:RNA polymerase sigma factor [Alkalihalobacterium elongatum]
MRKFIMSFFNKKANQTLDLSTQKVIYNQYYPCIYRTAYRYCADENIAKDIVQETFIRAFKYISTYEEKENGSFEAWLVTIARNEALKYIKSVSKRNETLIEEVEINERQLTSLEIEIINRLTLEELQEIIQELPEISKIIFLLRYVNDLSYKEISERLDLKENAVRQRAFRIRSFIQKEIQKERDHDEQSEMG